MPIAASRTILAAIDFMLPFSRQPVRFTLHFIGRNRREQNQAMQRWLARFSFSFFIIAAALAWEIHKIIASGASGQTWRIVLYAILIGICTALGAAGVRARHQH